MGTSTSEDQRVCTTCGTTASSEEQSRLSWSLCVQDGRAQWTCERCSRENVRSIESKLDPAWW